MLVGGWVFSSPQVNGLCPTSVLGTQSAGHTSWWPETPPIWLCLSHSELLLLESLLLLALPAYLSLNKDTGQSPWQSAHCFVQFDQLSCPHFPLRSSQEEERQGQDNWILTVVTAKLIELKTLKLNMTLTLS